MIERCPDTGLLVGYVPGSLGAHNQEVIAMLLEDGVASFSRGWMGFFSSLLGSGPSIRLQAARPTDGPLEYHRFVPVQVVGGVSARRARLPR